MLQLKDQHVRVVLSIKEGVRLSQMFLYLRSGQERFLPSSRLLEQMRTLMISVPLRALPVVIFGDISNGQATIRTTLHGDISISAVRERASRLQLGRSGLAGPFYLTLSKTLSRKASSASEKTRSRR